MSTLHDRLSALKVEVTSPDNRIKARLVGGDDLTIAFRDGAYASYGERDLEHQLERLAVLAWVGYRRGYLKLLSADTGEPESDLEKPHWNAKYRRYHEDVAEMVGKGASPSGLIEMRSKGLAFWKVRIKKGALTQLDEQRFINEAVVTFKRVRTNSEHLRTLLKDQHFGLNLPPKARARSLS